MMGSAHAVNAQPRDRKATGLWIIIAAYLLCASLAAWFMPWSQDDDRWPVESRARYSPPDEGAHLEYVSYLITHRSLPVFDDPDRNYEAHQPPIYYLTCIPAYLMGLRVSRWLSLPSPFAGSVLLVRAWSVLIGAAVIWAVYVLALLLFREDRRKALLAAGFAALLPMHFVNLAGVTNDGLAELIVTLCIIKACTLASDPSDRNSLVLGLLAGVAMLVKSNSLFIFLVAGCAVILATRDIENESVRLCKVARSIGLMLAAAVIVCGWWWVRNQLLYGDPLAQRVFVQLFKADRATPEWFLERGISGTGYLTMILWGTAMSFWGVFGQANVYQPQSVYVLGWAFALVAMAGLVRSLQSGRRPWRGAEASWLLASLSLAFVVAFYLHFNMIFYQVQARYLFTAIGPIAALFAGGWCALWRTGESTNDRTWATEALWGVWWCFLATLALVALFYLRPGAPLLGLPFVGA